MKNTIPVFLVSFFLACSPKSEQKIITEGYKNPETIKTETASADSTVKKSNFRLSDVKGPLQMGVEYPEHLLKGRSYSAKLNLKTNREIEIVSIEYSAPESYKGSKPAADKSLRRMKSSSQSENAIPFAIQNDMKDGYLVVKVTYVYNDQTMTASSSIRLFADEYLDKGTDIQIKETDGSTTNLKVLQN